MPPRLTGTEGVARFLFIGDDARVEPELAKLFARRSLPTARRGYDREATDALLDELKSCLETLLAERNAAQAQAAELAEQLAAGEVAEATGEPESEYPVEPDETCSAAADEPLEEKAEEPQTEPELEREPPIEAANPPLQVAQPEPEKTEADDIEQAAAMHRAAVLDEFAETNEELERLAEEARARVRALVERLSPGSDSEG